MRWLLLDLDGVIRHFDRSVADELELGHGLEPGSLRRAAFDHPRGRAAITGELTRAEWTDQVGRDVGSVEAARAWLGTWGFVDVEMLRALDQIRGGGTPVAVLTNGTDTIEAELASCGLDDAFDRVFCSWFLQCAKPDPEVFRTVCAELGVEPGDVTFFDDSAANVEGARTAGLAAEVFVDAEQVLAAAAPIGR